MGIGVIKKGDTTQSALDKEVGTKKDWAEKTDAEREAIQKVIDDAAATAREAAEKAALSIKEAIETPVNAALNLLKGLGEIGLPEIPALNVDKVKAVEGGDKSGAIKHMLPESMVMWLLQLAIGVPQMLSTIPLLGGVFDFVNDIEGLNDGSLTGHKKKKSPVISAIDENLLTRDGQIDNVRGQFGLTKDQWDAWREEIKDTHGTP